MDSLAMSELRNEMKEDKMKKENQREIEKIEEEMPDLEDIEVISPKRDEYEVEEESLLIEMKDALSSHRYKSRGGHNNEGKRQGGRKEELIGVREIEQKKQKLRKIKQVRNSEKRYHRSLRPHIRLKQRYSFTTIKKMDGMERGCKKYLYVVTNKKRENGFVGRRQKKKKTIKLDKIKHISLSKIKDFKEGDGKKIVKKPNLNISSHFLAAPNQQFSGIFSTGTGRGSRSHLKSLGEIQENRITYNKGKFKLRQLKNASAQNLNQSFNNSILNSHELSQDIDESAFLDASGFLDASNAEISFYGSNAEQSVIHSCLSHTMNEEGQTLVNQYKLINSIGRGSFGKVVKAFDTKTKKYFAIKILKKSKMKLKVSLSLGTANGYDVLNEINIIKKTDHPHIVKLHEVIGREEDEKIYLVMDYMKRGSILGSRYWKWRRKTEGTPKGQKKLSSERSRKYFRQLAKAIQYCMHNVLNVIHRDIKPGNILVDENDDVKLSDFGVSEMMDMKKKHTQNKSGTKFYLPPEVFHERSFDARAIDIWSLGVTLYYFLHGSLPYYTANQDDYKNVLINSEPEYSEKLEPSLTNLLKRLLEKDPKNRIEINEILVDDWVTNNQTEPLLNLPETMRNLDPENDLQILDILTTRSQKNRENKESQDV